LITKSISKHRVGFTAGLTVGFTVKHARTPLNDVVCFVR